MKNKYSKYLDELEFINKSLPLYIIGKVNSKAKKVIYFKLNKYIKKNKKDPDRIDLLINATGGCIFQAYEIIKLLNSVSKEVNAYICEDCFSASVLIALGCKSIYVSPYVKGLGSLDAQRLLKDGVTKSIKDYYEKANHIHGKFKLKKNELTSKEKAVIGHMNFIANKYIREIISEGCLRKLDLSRAKKKEIAIFLTKNQIPHNVPIPLDQFEKYGFCFQKTNKIETKIIENILSLDDLNRNKFNIQALRIR